MRFDRVLVLGGSGFVGRHLVAELARGGTDVTVPSRRRERAKHLILLPTVDVVEADVREAGALEGLVRGHDAVVNLVGVLHGPDFSGPHVELPLALVSACRAAGVRRLVHVSALGADADAASEYQRTKAKGEQAVLDATDLQVTVFRPSVVFGPEDQFLNRFATLAKLSPVLTLPCADARFQPVYVGDVARAIATTLGDTDTFGHRYDLGGPREYTLRELVEFVCKALRVRRLIVGLPGWAAYMQAFVLENLPGPLMSRDNYRSMQVPNVTAATFPFGLVPRPLEAVAPLYLAGGTSTRDRYPQLRWRARR